VITVFVSSDCIRDSFSQAMSAMYRAEVPQYGQLIALVGDINQASLEANPEMGVLLRASGLDSLNRERHGAIRLGTAAELKTMRRVLAAMGMFPVGYYDLSMAGIPVHSTAFRPVDETALARSPFRLFTSLLRLELIADENLRRNAAEILGRRKIFSAQALALVARHETSGGLNQAEAEAFVEEILETFRWHGEATVDANTYGRLCDAHRLVADIISFKGPHINHLTPRTLDIDIAHAEMARRGLGAKAVIEGPPARKCPILLRQTSFKALEERVTFPGAGGAVEGTHTARFGEIEQRGQALTRKGRALYDRQLAIALSVTPNGSSRDYGERLCAAFVPFPDDYGALRREGLGFFRHCITEPGFIADAHDDLDALIAQGSVKVDPIIYEDFLPVSAAGIFQSNLDGTSHYVGGASGAKAVFEEALGSAVLDEFELYAQVQRSSLEMLYGALERPKASHVG
jgi:uncharacterized glyoxalase superfamily metalloenzyme YdcJ